MESVGSPEEEVKLNTHVTAPHIINSSSSSPPFLVHVSNIAADISLVSENGGIQANKYVLTETGFGDRGGKYPSSAVGGIRDHLTLKAIH